MTLRGELDITCVELLEKALAAAEATVPPVIIVDLAHLEFMDSSGLAAMIKAKQKADGCGWRLGIVNATGAVHRVFELTALESLLE